MKRLPGFSAYRSPFWLSLLLISASTGWSQSVTLSIMPTTVTIHPGDQNVPVSVSVGSSPYSGPVVITLAGLPSGITVSPLTLNAGGSGTIFLSASVAAGQELFNPPANNGIYAESKTVDVTAVAGLTQVTLPLTLTVSLSNPSFAPAAGAVNLPIVNINTNGVAIVDKTTEVPGTITIAYANGQTSYLPNSSDTDNTGTFHLHGNSTLIFPKKAYHVKLNTSLDVLTTMGLSCPYVTSKGKPTCDKSKSYVLLANYDDKTFLRDWTASALANAIPIGGSYLNSPADSPTPSGTSTLMPWAPHSLFVELYINGAYEGNYQLIEQVKVDGNRVNISELSESDTTDDITGGYLMEIDRYQDEAFIWVTPKSVDLGLIDPDFTPDPEVPEQTSYISNYTDAAEDALFSANFTDPTLGWRAYFDEASAVNFYIVNDLMGNGDGARFFSSDYLYKSKDNPLIYMGPIWDFDISSGNVSYQAIEDPTVPYMQIDASWYEQWFKDPGFAKDVSSQWNALKNNGVFTVWLASISAEAATLQQSQANNFGRWPMQGIQVWPNQTAVGSYNGEVTYLVDWLTVRMGYLDSLFNVKSPTSTTLTLPGGTLRSGSPVTLQATVTGGSGPTGSVAFLSDDVVLGLAPLGTSGTASFVTTRLHDGPDSLEAVYVGDNKNALSKSTVVSPTVLPPLDSTVTSLSSSLSSTIPGLLPTFSVVVVPNSGTAVLTGMVSFTANGNSLGSVAVAGNGTATFSPAGLPLGTDLIQAIYSGDGTYRTSSSNIVSLSVTTGLPPGDPFDFSSGFAESQGTLQFNGSAALAGTAIELTNGGLNEGGSAFFTLPVNIQSFTTDFTFQLTNAAADGFTFTIQNAGLSALGLIGGSLGYTGIGESVAIKFDLYQNGGNSGDPSNDSTGIFVDGTAPIGPTSIDLTGSGINLHSGDKMGAYITYDGTTLNLTLADLTTLTIWSHPFVINIPATVGGNTAYVGFTGGTGGGTSIQKIFTWSYKPGQPLYYPKGFSSTSAISKNGSAALAGTAIELTNGGLNEGGSVFFTSPVNIQLFTSDFTFQLTNAAADGFTFTIQNAGLSALGLIGGSLGYTGIGESVAIKFDLYQNGGNSGDPSNDSTGIFVDGTAPIGPTSIDLTGSGINLHSGDKMDANLTYDGTTLTLTITDLVTLASWSHPFAINVPATVGGNTAYVGFTGGTGGGSATQQILSWTFD